MYFCPKKETPPQAFQPAGDLSSYAIIAFLF